MREIESDPAASWDCAHCGLVIGVYEPLIHVVGTVARRTSRAADPELVRGRQGALYHLACSRLGHVEPASAE